MFGSRLGRSIHAVVVACVALTLLSSPEGLASTGKSVSFGRVPRSVVSGGSFSVTVTFAPGAYPPFDDWKPCVASSGHAALEIAEASPLYDVLGGTLSVTLPRRTQGHSLAIRVSCPGGASATTRVAVRMSSRKQGARGSRYPILRFTPATRPYTVAELHEQAHAMWVIHGAGDLTGYRGTGLSTDWASQKRPDVIQRVFEGDYVAEVQGQPAERLGDPLTWAAVAGWAGMTVSETPVAGALVVWQPGVEGAAAPGGHLGYVESVSADGSMFSTSEMDLGAVGQIGYRTLSSAPVAGRAFISP